MNWVVLLLSLTSVAVRAVVVETEYGPVEGRTVPVFNGLTDTEVDTFYAIPFGKSTEGENRFMV